jgi:hypothetical protein
VVISSDTRKQQSPTTNFSLLFVLSYITSMNEGLRLLICMVVMVRETVMVEDCRNRPAMVSGSKTITTGDIQFAGLANIQALNPKLGLT